MAEAVNLAKLTQSAAFDEGDKPTPYLDTRGLWTVGIGRCLEKNPLTTGQWKWLLDNKAASFTLTEIGSQYLFSLDIADAQRQLKNRCDFWGRLDDVTQNILIEMCFQLGIDHLLAFNKMFAALRINDLKEAGKQGLDSVWAKEDSPKRAQHLMDCLQRGVFP